MFTDEGFLKRRFLESRLTEFSTICNFGNTLATTIIFFWNFLIFHVDSTNETKKIRKVIHF